MRDEEPEPEFVKADLMPSDVQWRCPSCGETQHADLEEDEAGLWSVRLEDRYRQCECGANVDIGWSGWRWLDGSAGKHGSF